MANADLEFLRDQFRRDVDDIDIDPTDQSGLLWSDDDVLDYIDDAHSEFIARTLYRSSTLRIPFDANSEVIPFSERVLDTKDTKAYLEVAKRVIPEVNATDLIQTVDDYDTALETNPYESLPAGTPRAFSIDTDERSIRLFPASSVDDVFVIPVYLEADRIASWDGRLNITNQRHIRMLLAGMKQRAYSKHDADVFNKEEADYWFAVFESHINKVEGERNRRSSRPGTIKYGGL